MVEWQDGSHFSVKGTTARLEFAKKVPKGLSNHEKQDSRVTIMLVRTQTQAQIKESKQRWGVKPAILFKLLTETRQPH
jgi:outer membrane receptor for monomeric catechols